MMTRSNNQGKGDTQSENISVVHFNARILLQNIDELHCTVTRLNGSVAAVTETWLSSTFRDEALSPNGYHMIYRSNRDNNQRGGG